MSGEKTGVAQLTAAAAERRVAQGEAEELAGKGAVKYLKV